MAKNRFPVCYPLEAAKEFCAELGKMRIFDLPDICSAALDSWDEFSSDVSGLTKGVYSPDKDTVKRLKWLSGILGTWLLNKQIYSVKQEICSDLLASDCSGVLMRDLKMPYPCIYIDVSECGLVSPVDDAGTLEGDVKGWFVSLSHEGEFLLLSIYGISVCSGETWYAQNVVSVHDSDAAEASLCDLLCEIDRVSEGKHTHFRSALMLAAYIASASPDVSENEAQRRIYRPTKDPLRYASVRKWDVGVRYGTALSAHAHKNVSFHGGGHGHRRSPRPHFRKGHYHTYLVGEGRKDRKVIWVAPCAVGLSSGVKGDDIPAVIHRVMK